MEKLFSRKRQHLRWPRVAALSLGAGLVLAAALAFAHEPPPSPRTYPLPDTDVAVDGDGCYPYTRSGRQIRTECVFRVSLTTSTPEASLDYGDLERRIWAQAGDELRSLGFDTVQVLTVWPRERLAERLGALDLHFSSAPASVVVETTQSLRSVLDWDYEPVAVYQPYRSVILTRKGSAIRSFEDLQGDTLAAVDESSSSGYRIPFGYLRARGIYPTPVFLRGSHEDVVQAVVRGDVVAGATHDHWRDALSDVDADVLQAYVVPHLIPGQSWVLRRDLATRPGLVARLVAAVDDWGRVRNIAGGYWSDLSPATPDILEGYDGFRNIEQALRDSAATRPIITSPATAP